MSDEIENKPKRKVYPTVAVKERTPSKTYHDVFKGCWPIGMKQPERAKVRRELLEDPRAEKHILRIRAATKRSRQVHREYLQMKRRALRYRARIPAEIRRLKQTAARAENAAEQFLRSCPKKKAKILNEVNQDKAALATMILRKHNAHVQMAKTALEKARMKKQFEDARNLNK
jgi:hypothetical protein